MSVFLLLALGAFGRRGSALHFMNQTGGIISALIGSLSLVNDDHEWIPVGFRIGFTHASGYIWSPVCTVVPHRTPLHAHVDNLSGGVSHMHSV